MTSNESTILESNKVEEAYLSALDSRLSILAREPGATFLTILRGARGAFPTLVAERLKGLGMSDLLPQETAPAGQAASGATGPELHPLDFEWYFSSESATQIAELLAAQGGDILCLATPTAAATLARRGLKVLLLDNNPLNKLRLPAGLSNLQFRVFNLYDPLHLDRSFPVVFFDAPWYAEPVTYWLWQASQAVSPGGIIAFSLFPPLLRPGAESERSRILAQARAMGEVEIREEALSYETPLFEQEALARCGLRITTAWRRGDLVLVHVNRRPRMSPPPSLSADDEWETFLIGTQVVKLRKHTRGAQNFILAPLDDLGDYIFPTVSMRDSRRAQIDLWTSRNRVSKVGRRDLVASVLAGLAQGMSIADIAESPVLSPLAVNDREALLTNLCLILEIPPEERHGPTHNRSAIR
jgi:hypothetical protein